MAQPPEQRFWTFVDKAGPIPECRPDLGPCWIWTGKLSHNGYGEFSLTHRKSVRAARFAYELESGQPMAKDLVPDHLCRTRACIRPSHLEPVTTQVNLLRGATVNAKNAEKTHCLNGHPLSGYNLYFINNQRQCKTCRRVRVQQFRARTRTG